MKTDIAKLGTLIVVVILLLGTLAMWWIGRPIPEWWSHLTSGGVVGLLGYGVGKRSAIR